jgi:hypothetical protein
MSSNAASTCFREGRHRRLHPLQESPSASPVLHLLQEKATGQRPRLHLVVVMQEIRDTSASALVAGGGEQWAMPGEVGRITVAAGDRSRRSSGSCHQRSPPWPTATRTWARALVPACRRAPVDPV